MPTDTRGVLYVVTAITVALLCALLVGWNLILIENYLLAIRINEDEGHWIILSVGCVFFLLVMVTVVLLVRFLVRTDERRRFQQLLLDSVTHELKSPLASIRLLLETLQMRQLPPERERQLKAMVLEDLARLDQLIEHMLQAGRLEQRHRVLEIEPIDLGEMVERVVSLARRRRGHRFTVEIDVSRCPERFLTDGPTLEIVLFNLIDNAIKYSRGEAHVSLVLSTDESGRLLLSVRDWGVGLEKRDLRRVFRRFYRASVDDEPRDGAGLGLFVVASLVRQLGGRSWAESAGSGSGSTFYVAVPPGTAVGVDELRQRAA